MQKPQPPRDQTPAAELREIGRTIAPLREERGMRPEELMPRCEMTVQELEAWFSTDPTGGVGAWATRHDVDPGHRIIDVSCPSSAFCAAVDGAGLVATSPEPREQSETWAVAKLNLGTAGSISCPSAALCVAAGLGNVVIGTPAPLEEGAPPSGGQPPAAGAEWPASITLPARRLFLIRDGKVKVPITCESPFTGCTGGIRLSVPAQRARAGGHSRPAWVKVGAAYFAIGTDTTKAITIPLSKRGRRLLAGKKKVAARLIVGGRAMGKVISLRENITLKGR